MFGQNPFWGFPPFDFLSPTAQRRQQVRQLIREKLNFLCRRYDADPNFLGSQEFMTNLAELAELALEVVMTQSNDGY